MNKNKIEQNSFSMKEQKRKRFEESLKRKHIKELLVKYAYFNCKYHMALKLYLMHPSPPYKEEDLDFIGSINIKLEIVKTIIDEKTLSLNQQ